VAALVVLGVYPTKKDDVTNHFSDAKLNAIEPITDGPTSAKSKVSGVRIPLPDEMYMYTSSFS